MAAAKKTSPKKTPAAPRKPRKLKASNDPIERFRRVLTPQSRVLTRLFFSDIEAAVLAADSGNMKLAGLLCSAIRADGTATGQISTRFDGLQQLPRYIEGPDEEIAQALREEFDTVFPATELSSVAADGALLGLMFAELVDDEEAGGLRLLRRELEWTQYRRSEDRWYVQTSLESLQPIIPGDGRWVFATPGGVEHPWRGRSIWRALARAFVSKEHSIYFRDNFCQTLAWPAKAPCVTRVVRSGDLAPRSAGVNAQGARVMTT